MAKLTNRLIVKALVKEVRRLRLERDTWQRAADDPDFNYSLTRAADRLDARQSEREKAHATAKSM